MFADDEDCDCPLCMEEFDLSDRGFRPCPCGYQICRFCWHHIKENLNGRCPACRSLYSEQTVQFVPISQDEIARIKKEKKVKDRREKEMGLSNRKHLSNTRVVQKNLMYVLGLTAKYANEETELFRQFGKVSKIVVSKRHGLNSATENEGQSTVGIYVTYNRKEDAAKAINGLDGTMKDGNVLRVSYGTTKYCTYYLSHLPCPNPSCMYLHEPGEESDSYNKENLSIGKQQLSEVQNRTVSGSPLSALNARKAARKDSPTKAQIQKSLSSDTTNDKPALPAKARWATSWTTTDTKDDESSGTEITPEHFGPSLSDALTLPQKPKHSPSLPKRKEKRIPRSTKAVRLDMIDSATLEAATEVPATTTSKSDVISVNEKEDERLQVVETKEPELPAPVPQEPKVPKGWAIIPTVKPETAKPPALAKLGQNLLPARGEKRPARTDSSKRKEKRQHQLKSEDKDTMARHEAVAVSKMEITTTDNMPLTEVEQKSKQSANDKHMMDSKTKPESPVSPQDGENVSQKDADNVSSSEKIAIMNDQDDLTMEDDSGMAIESVEITDSQRENEKGKQVDIALESRMAEDDGSSSPEVIDELGQKVHDLNEEDEALDEDFAAHLGHDELRDADQGSDSNSDDQSSFEFDDGEDILIEKLLSDETDDELDVVQSYPAKTDGLSAAGELNPSESPAQGFNNVANQQGGGMKQLKMPPGLGYPNMNSPMTPPPPPFGFSPMHHQSMPPFMHRGFPPGLMPPPGMLPRGYDPFMGQDAEMMMARRLQHSQQMIAALGMMNTGDRSRGPSHLPPPRPIPMHGAIPGVPPPPHLSEHAGQMFPTGSPSPGPLQGHPLQSPLHSPFGFRGDSHSPLREASLPPPPPPAQQHSPYHQITRAQDILPLQQTKTILPESNQVRSMQEGFRALLPNVNISFGPPAGSNIQMNQQGGDSMSVPRGINDDTNRIYGTNIATTPSLSVNRPRDDHRSPEYRHRVDTPPHIHQQPGLQHPHDAGQPMSSLNNQPPFLVSSGNLSSPPNADFEGFHDSQQRQRGWQKPPLSAGFANQQQPVNDLSNEMLRMRLDSAGAGRELPPFSQQMMENPVLNSSVAQEKEEDAKDIRSEAQNFFGNFLKQAAAHQQQSEKESEETSKSANLPFHDPAIMAARVAAPNQNTAVEPRKSPLHSHPAMQYRPSPPLSQDTTSHHNVPVEGYQQRPPMFSPQGDRYMNQQSPHQPIVSQPYMFRNTAHGPSGIPSPYMHSPPPPHHGPPQHFPIMHQPDLRNLPMPPPPHGMSPEEHHHRMEHFMRANSGSL